MKLLLLTLVPLDGRPKSDQLRHEACDLVTPNQQRATFSGVILASTRRAEPILSPCFVRNRLFNQLNDTLSAAQTNKMDFGSDSFISANRP